MAEQSTGEKIPLLIDDDGSLDGLIALLYWLKQPGYDVRAVTVACGEGHPKAFAPQLARLLAGLGREDIPVGAGREAPLDGSNAFPDPWRQAADAFWGIQLPPYAPETQPVSASDLIVETLSSSPQPVVVFASGNLTNLAEALRLQPGIAAKIARLEIMGGAIYTPGNIHADWPEFDNEAAEWNIWVDPAAASEVFSAGLPLYLTPLDATNQVAWSEADAQAWAAGSPEGETAAALLRQMAGAMGSSYIWDLAAAIRAAHPELCPETRLPVQIVTAPGSTQGQTMIGTGAANAAVCLQPDAGAFRLQAAAVFGK